MRASLLHPLRQPRRVRARREGHERVLSAVTATHRPEREQAMHHGDPAVLRVREAGGPIDLASYTCGCGYVFSASVSTSVMCPHCGADQAW